MVDFLVKSTANIYNRFVYNGLPVGGTAVVTLTVCSPAGTAILTGVAASAVVGEPGTYSYSIDDSLTVSIGHYHAIWTCDYNGATIVSDQYFSVGYAPFGSIAMEDVRDMISNTEIDDLYTGSPSAIGANTFTLAKFSTYPDDEFRGAYVYVRAGVGYGYEYRVASFSAGIFTLTENFNVLPDTSSVLEIHKKYSVTKINTAIRRAQLSVANRIWVPITDSSITLTSAKTYPVPAVFSFIHEVYTEDAVGRTLVPRDTWSIDRGNRTITVEAASAGNKLVLLGSGKVGDLNNDFSFVEVNPDYLVLKATAYLRRSKSAGPQTDADNNMQSSLVYEQEAMRILQRTPQRIPANSRSVD